MKIFLAGASGAIGQPLVRQLLERGHEVVGMTRSRASAIEALGAQAVVADAFDADAVRAAVAAAQPNVVVNELTDLGRPLDPRKYEEWLAGTNRLRRGGAKNLIDAAGAAGAFEIIFPKGGVADKFEPRGQSEGAPVLGGEAGEKGGGVAAPAG